jgi:hypothetical protein
MARIRTTALSLAGLALVASTSLAACTGSDDTPPPREPADVGLTIKGVDDVTIGVLVSTTSAAGEGSDYIGPSAGAELAGYRLRLGGTKVKVTVADDRGDSDEAETGVQTLIDQGVSGIVVATTGSHVLPALETASEAGVPVIAPYLRTQDDLPAGVYVTGPSEDAITASVEQAMQADEVSSPLVITADPAPAPAVGTAAPVQFTGAALDDIVDDATKAVEDKTVDSVVVSAPAASQGAVVAALQGAVPDVPLYLTPEALTPEFSASLDSSSGTTSGRFVSVGAPASDSSTLGSTAAADSAAAYFAALRLAAGDESFTSSLDGSPFSTIAADADLPSHDAVIALVRAAAKARSATAADVAAALPTLKLGTKQSLAGPGLDFSSPYALPADSVAPLYATTQDPGVRPVGDSPVLTWFELTDDGNDA